MELYHLVLLSVAIVWAVCSTLAYGLTFAHFQKEFPIIACEEYGRQRAFAISVGICGPVGLLVALMNGATKYGFKWR